MAYISKVLSWGVLALCIFSFFNWYKTRDKTTLYFSLWLLAAFFSILTTPVIDGIRFGEFVVDVSSYNFNSSVSFAHFLFMFFAFAQAMLFVVFAREFLNLKSFYPKVYWATNLYLIWYLCFFIFDVILQPFFHIQNARLFVAFPNIIATPLILTTLLIYSYKRCGYGDCKIFYVCLYFHI